MPLAKPDTMGHGVAAFFFSKMNVALTFFVARVVVMESGALKLMKTTNYDERDRMPVGIDNVLWRLREIKKELMSRGLNDKSVYGCDERSTPIVNMDIAIKKLEALMDAPPPTWDNCKHKWVSLVDSMWSNERVEDVRCDTCGCPGQRSIDTGDVYWPTT